MKLKVQVCAKARNKIITFKAFQYKYSTKIQYKNIKEITFMIYQDKWI